MKALIQYLSQFVTPRRLELFKSVASQRTRYVTLLLENIYQPHNASAVLRTCDCLGIQDVHIVEDRNPYTLNPDVELGAARWLTLHRYSQPDGDITQAINKLKSNGYRIVATTPHEGDVTVTDFDLSRGKTALLFGTELTGLSPQAISLSDEFLRIPMWGFTESFNISVSAAITLFELTRRLRESNLIWSLDDQEVNQLILDWLRMTIKQVDQIEKRYLCEGESPGQC
ncbi:MAG: RNA methyltransferase [Bacteroidales bacterium]